MGFGPPSPQQNYLQIASKYCVCLCLRVHFKGPIGDLRDPQFNKNGIPMILISEHICCIFYFQDLLHVLNFETLKCTKIKWIMKRVKDDDDDEHVCTLLISSPNVEIRFKNLRLQTCNISQKCNAVQLKLKCFLFLKR